MVSGQGDARGVEKLQEEARGVEKLQRTWQKAISKRVSSIAVGVLAHNTGPADDTCTKYAHAKGSKGPKGPKDSSSGVEWRCCEDVLVQVGKVRHTV